MVSDSVGPFNAIGRVAADGVRAALGGGYRVTVVADRLDDGLRRDVEWVKLYVPPRGFAVQWLTGRHWIRRAMAGRRFDVVHAHQPQVADLADVFQCHFLTRVAYERQALERRRTPRALAVRAQQQVVLHAEDYFYRRWNPATHMLFDSELTRREFVRLYGRPAIEQALPYAFPDLSFPSEAERRAAKVRWIGRVPDEPVVGYLGGLHERKGYRRLLDAARRESGWFLLMGGQFLDGFDAPDLRGRFANADLVTDTASFYAACDAFAVPSLFEPLGLVAFEAAARGVPVIATDEVGALAHLLECDAGLRWDPASPLLPLVQGAVANRHVFRSGAERMARVYGGAAYGATLLRTYQSVIDRRQTTGVPVQAQA